jgi:hypothetical protein
MLFSLRKRIYFFEKSLRWLKITLVKNHLCALQKGVIITPVPYKGVTLELQAWYPQLEE